ncbi:DNA polymerase Y family protein [Breoghania sp. L-A4]|uniref:Y-family DNA polymerase n=1 Tax=Breoghania sp. L-A4 TaxID=2304600 RepID=UPI0013C30AA4|nr:DNA polymerase Y family protein [Breoghania sp. L-A4]
MRTVAERRYLVLHLPRWATDCLKRHDPLLAGSAAPLVLYERQNNAMRLVALDDRARACGLGTGQTLSDARAMCPGIIAREIDRAETERLFTEFADWHSNLSPIVAVVRDWSAHEDLCVDITGAAHLFGGERAMLAMALRRLQGFGFSVQGAIAPSIGAALALGRFAPGQIVRPCGLAHDDGAPPSAAALREEGAGFHRHGKARLEPERQGPALVEALGPLPVAALRLSAEQIAGLHEMGLKTVGQLFGRDRAGLGARFGLSLLTRLDQALGRAREPLVPRLPVIDYRARRNFAEPIALIDDVLMTARDLAQQLSAQLEQAGLGAQTFHLMLYRVDHKLMHLAVNAAQATRDAGHVSRLFANRIGKLVEEFDAGFGIETIQLAASSVSELPDVQSGAFGTGDGAIDLDLLIDRLSSRLGAQAVLRPRFSDTHIPERAVTLAPAVTQAGQAAQSAADPTLKRPLRLLPAPEVVTVVAEVPDGPPVRMQWRRQGYRFVKAAGPERIGVEWWQPGEGAFTRDYYTAEDVSGRRFWLFREGLYTTETDRPRWFIHGLFA